jgi:hypothetical protein
MEPIRPTLATGPVFTTWTSTSRALGSDQETVSVLSRRTGERFSARGLEGSPVYRSKAMPLAPDGS